MTSAPAFSRRELMGALAAQALMATPALAASRADRIMVQGRPQDSTSLYKVRNIMPALDKLGGVRKMRCRIPYSGTVGWNTYVGLAREGVRFCFTLTTRDIETTTSDLRAFLKVAPKSVWAIEFPNEPDLNPVKYKGLADKRLGVRRGDGTAFLEFVKDAHAALRADPVLKSIPLIASNDWMLAEQKRFADYANTHIYPRPGSNVAQRLAEFERKGLAAGFDRGVITEWGRTTGGGGKNVTSPPVTLEQQASLLAADVAAALERPYILAINLYELFSWGGPSEMNNFGLFSADLSPRPVVSALRSVIR